MFPPGGAEQTISSGWVACADGSRATYQMSFGMFLIQADLRARYSVPVEHRPQLATVDMRQRIEPVNSWDSILEFDIVQPAGRQDKSLIPASLRQP